MDGFRGHVERRGGFLDTQSAEEAQLDDAALPVVDLRERLQSEVERDQVGRALDRHGHRIVERRRSSAGAPLQISLRSRDIDQNAAHQSRRHRKEVRPILPVELARRRRAEGRPH